MGWDIIDYAKQRRGPDYSIDPKTRQDESIVKSC
jgi:hypothetical protein